MVSRLRKLKDDILDIKHRVAVDIEDTITSVDLVQSFDERKERILDWRQNCERLFDEFEKGLELNQLESFKMKFQVSLFIIEHHFGSLWFKSYIFHRFYNM